MGGRCEWIRFERVRWSRPIRERANCDRCQRPTTFLDKTREDDCAVEFVLAVVRSCVTIVFGEEFVAPISLSPQTGELKKSTGAFLERGEFLHIIRD